jgi:hypothetical protein
LEYSRQSKLLAQPSAIGDMRGQHLLQFGQKPGRLGNVEAVTLQLGQHLALSGYLPLGLVEVSLGGCQMIFEG